MSLSSRLAELEKQFKRQQIGAPRSQGIVSSVLDVESEIARIKAERSAERLKELEQEFRSGAPTVSEETICKLVIHAITFTENHARELMGLMSIQMCYSSIFKRLTCFNFVISMIPDSIQVSSDLINGMIDDIVALMNGFQVEMDKLKKNQAESVAVQPKVKKSKFFGRSSESIS